MDVGMGMMIGMAVMRLARSRRGRGDDMMRMGMGGEVAVPKTLAMPILAIEELGEGERGSGEGDCGYNMDEPSSQYLQLRSHPVRESTWASSYLSLSSTA